MTTPFTVTARDIPGAAGPERPRIAGRLYGIGVGPGDPDLITLRAVRALGLVDVILAASSSRNEYSLALSIARPHIPEHTRVVDLAFPMTRDAQALRLAWEKNARLAASLLLQGNNAAFLTLGDPLIYSTFGYLMRTLETLAPEIPVTVIPGISSFQAAAAATRTVLCEGGENLLLQAGINSRKRLAEELRMADNAVLLKAYKNLPAIRQAFADAGKSDNALFVSSLGHTGETVNTLENAPEKPGYLSLILAPKTRRG